MSAEVAAVLRDARALIEDPERWTKRGFVSYNAVGLESYCALGAVAELKISGKRIPTADRADAWYSLAVAAGGTHWSAVGYFNDGPDTSHADVLALFDRAIADEEGRP